MEVLLFFGLRTKNEHDDFLCPQKFIAYPQPHEILKCPFYDRIKNTEGRMDIQNLILYVFDVVMLVAFARMLMVSNTVKIETKVGNKMKWMIPVLFLAIAIIGFVRYEGVFRIVQFIVPIILGVMYYFMKSGLSDEGIVMMGSLIKFHKAGQVMLSRSDNSIYFVRNKIQTALFFEEDQFDEVRNFLKEHSVKSDYLKKI